MYKKYFFIGSFLVLFELEFIGSDFRLPRSSSSSTEITIEQEVVSVAGGGASAGGLSLSSPSFDSDSDVDVDLRCCCMCLMHISLFSAASTVTTNCYLENAPILCTAAGIITTSFLSIKYVSTVAEATERLSKRLSKYKKLKQD